MRTNYELALYILDRELNEKEGDTSQTDPLPCVVYTRRTGVEVYTDTLGKIRDNVHNFTKFGGEVSVEIFPNFEVEVRE